MATKEEVSQKLPVDQGFKATWTKLRGNKGWGIMTIGQRVVNDGFYMVQVTKKSGETSAEFLGECVGRFTTDEGFDGAFWTLEKNGQSMIDEYYVTEDDE